MFEGVRGSSIAGDISVDDVVVEDKRCTCKFADKVL